MTPETPPRAPYPRDGSDMDLPLGKTCGDCVHISRCREMFGHQPSDLLCDWSPCRFASPRPEDPPTSRRPENPPASEAKRLCPKCELWGNCEVMPGCMGDCDKCLKRVECQSTVCPAFTARQPEDPPVAHSDAVARETDAVPDPDSVVRDAHGMPTAWLNHKLTVRSGRRKRKDVPPVAKHTRELWEWQKVEKEGCVTEWTLEGPKKVLCRFWYDAPPSDEALAIASATELLESCQELVNVLGRLPIMDPLISDAHTACKRGRALIFKATGEEVGS